MCDSQPGRQRVQLKPDSASQAYRNLSFALSYFVSSNDFVYVTLHLIRSVTGDGRPCDGWHAEELLLSFRIGMREGGRDGRRPTAVEGRMKKISG